MPPSPQEPDDHQPRPDDDAGEIRGNGRGASARGEGRPGRRNGASRSTGDRARRGSDDRRPRGEEARRPRRDDDRRPRRDGERRPGRDEHRGSSRGDGPRRAREDRAPRGADRGSRAGRDREDRPERPFRPARKPAPRRPALPEDRPVIPRDAWRDLRATVPAGVLDDVVKAVGVATDALADGHVARATELLTWAKSVAPRSAAIREALGIAHYAAERYSEAHSELLAYRRLSGSHDQNHVLADCARAAGRHDKVVEYVDQMIAARVDPGRVAEGLMVLAGERADRGDLEGALETLQRADLDPERVQDYHPRLWYLAGDLSERLGRSDAARDYFEAILALDEEFGDVAERLRRLE